MRCNKNFKYITRDGIIWYLPLKLSITDDGLAAKSCLTILKKLLCNWHIFNPTSPPYLTLFYFFHYCPHMVSTGICLLTGHQTRKENKRYTYFDLIFLIVTRNKYIEFQSLVLLYSLTQSWFMAIIQSIT